MVEALTAFFLHNFGDVTFQENFRQSVGLSVPRPEHTYERVEMQQHLAPLCPVDFPRRASA